MVEHMLDFMLGPMRSITGIYMDNLLICNSAVFISYFGAKLFKKKKVTSEQTS
ncbi:MULTISPECIES: hypothetical protein [Mammaliicoccus]|uniref:Uncharacterized protein n=1 Tax=Mammaliicoccus vitulinus TaxID=71237 RepID=A0ABX7HIJ9_9STAP|nr:MULTISPECIES: hypothetical protein [Mammaliicoccus]MBM6629511.1 hypothetical protein [Mammaliicoccus vitulinus]MBO3077829.1 hypothetical protein [Mammaliicoccus vitulinus]MEB7657452.1 hypothetical protein [Mammaliicoccus vitulinus]QJF26078.1 hypothetical protein HF021_11810 [Mammaliicoccus vitulinus]QQT14907.1 hypothetical protein I6J10_10040 [Mammaliicoccus vitulinus]